MTDPVDALVRWDGATSWWAGTRALEAALDGLLRGTVRVVVDAGFAATAQGEAMLARLHRLVGAAGAVADVSLHASGSTTVTSTREAALDWSRRPADVHVLVGGGSTIDFGVLAALPEEDREVLDRAGGRCGLVVLPSAPRRRRGPVVVAVPTTLGTGAEVSHAACVDRGGRKVLVVGPALRPEVAVCDPEATAGLPHELVGEAVVEVLARLVVPFAAAPQQPARRLAHALGDDHVLADVVALLRVARCTGPGRLGGQERLALAAVSAHSHAGWGHVGRSPFASALWFLATELSQALGWSKNRATAALLPAWTRAVLGGDERWGDGPRLRRFLACADDGVDGWLTERGGVPGVVGSLVPGATTQAPTEVAGTVAAACVRRWGGGLPMLGTLTRADVAELVALALDAGTPLEAGAA